MRLGLTGLALTGALTTAGLQPSLAHPDHTIPSILVIVAHPDDELVFAPAIAAATRKGSDVRLVFATSGDAGPGVSDFEKGEALAKARETEATCSANALGVEDVEFLRFGDGTLADQPRDVDSPARKLLDRIESEIAEESPDVIITWGPDGGYGHRDHRMIHALVTQAVQARTKEARPELYYPAFVHTPLPELLKSQGWAMTAPDLAAVRHTYGPGDLAAANVATQCHKTQFDEATRAALAPGFHVAVWKGEVAFRKAF